MAISIHSVLLRTFATLSFSTATLTVIAVSVVHSAVLATIGYLYFRKRQGKDRALLAGACIGVNLGLFVYPFAEAVWGSVGLQTAVIFDLANQWALLLVQYFLFRQLTPQPEGAPPRTSLASAVLRRAASNPALLAVYFALAINFLGIPLPPAIDAISAPLATANKPLALLALGIMLEFAVQVCSLSRQTACESS
jgi:hypothetical protein